VAELMRVQTGSGMLYVTDNSVRLDVPHRGFGSSGARSVVIFRSAITGISYEQTVPSFFGKYGAMSLLITAQDGRTLEVRTVPTKDAQRIIEMLS